MLKLGIRAQALLLPKSMEHTSVFITKLRGGDWELKNYFNGINHNIKIHPKHHNGRHKSSQHHISKISQIL